MCPSARLLSCFSPAAVHAQRVGRWSVLSSTPRRPTRHIHVSAPQQHNNARRHLTTLYTSPPINTPRPTNPTGLRAALGMDVLDGRRAHGAVDALARRRQGPQVRTTT